MKLDSSISAVVTGGASGLGRATAEAIAATGAKVAIFDRHRDPGEAVAKEIGGIFCEVDIASEEQIVAGFQRARAAHGQERVLINCAGTGNAVKTIRRVKETGEIRPYELADFRRIIEVNLIGTFACITHAAAGMASLDPLEDDERGSIVNTASIAAEDGQVGQVAYAASKAGIVGLTLPVARDLMNEGIRINTILPGIFATPPMLVDNGALAAHLTKAVPFPKRLGLPDEFARLAIMMVENTYFNGEDVRLDGAIRFAPR